MPNYSKHSEYVFDIEELKKLFDENPTDTKVYISISFEQEGSKIFRAKILAETGKSGEKSLERGSGSASGCPDPPGC